MPHMVIFKNDGKPGYHQVDDLDGALRFVEHLRNNEGVEQAQVFRLDEVPIEIKTVFKVVARNGSSAPAGEAPANEEPDGAEVGVGADGAAKRGIFR